MLGAMLGAHSECITTPESQFKFAMLQYLEEGHQDALSLLRIATQHWRFKLWEIDINLEDFSNSEVGSTYRDVLNWLVKQYGCSHQRPNPQLWIDHSPGNVRYATALLSQLPDSKFIHIVRDGRAVAASIMPLDWGPNTVIHAAPWWLSRLSHGLALEQLLSKNQIMRVRYEDIVQNPAMAMQGVSDFIGVDYQPAMLQGDGFIPPQYTRRQHAKVGKPPDLSRMSAWQSTLPQRHIEIFESLTQEMLVYLGYTPLYGLRARSAVRRERIVMNIQELCFGMLNRLRVRYRHCMAFRKGAGA